MSQKRDPDECSSKKNLEGNQSPDDKRRRILRSFRSVVLEVITQIRFQRIQQALEPMLRKVVSVSEMLYMYPPPSLSSFCSLL